MSPRCRAKDPSRCRTHGQPATENIKSAVADKDVSRYLSARETLENESEKQPNVESKETSAVAKPAEQTVDVQAATNAFASTITGFNVKVRDDGDGPYIRMESRTNKDDFRCMALTPGEDADAPPTWRFWCDASNTNRTSALGADADPELVTRFLNKSFSQEMRDHLKKSMNERNK